VIPARYECGFRADAVEPRPKRACMARRPVGGEPLLATVSLSELLLGIASLPAGKRRSALASALDEQIISLFAERIVPFDIAGAEAYAQIVTRARRHGHSIAVADAQIAAIAASRRFNVATRDEAPSEPLHHGHQPVDRGARAD